MSFQREALIIVREWLNFWILRDLIWSFSLIRITSYNVCYTKLLRLIDKEGADKISFIRIEAGTNLIGGQPVALDNFIETGKIARKYKIPFIVDASLWADNLHFIKTREEKYKNHSTREITRILADAADIVYFSARKLGHVRGGGIITNDEAS